MRPESGCPVCDRVQDVIRTRIESAVPRTNNSCEFENITHSADAILVKCPVCGEFVVTDQDDLNLRSPSSRSQSNFTHLSALLREQSIRPLPRFWLQYVMAPYGPLNRTDLAPIDLNELLARWPRTVPERIDRTLCNLARLSPTGGHELSIENADTALAFASSSGEVQYTIEALRDLEFLKSYDQSTKGFGVFVTPEGWAHFEMLTKGSNSPENPVFVAMWFGGTEEKSNMDEAFQQAIQPAIEQAGYRATRVDLSEHNDWIMDKVLGDIRTAPFVVADFTGNRNGVYFEAGFARGLGIRVIHTCREEHLDQAHFDTKQLNHVLWQTPADLRKKLYHRIVGSIGLGPHPLPDIGGQQSKPDVPPFQPETAESLRSTSPQ